MSATADRDPLLPEVVEFGEFRLDLLRYRLQRNGEPVKLGTKPCEVLGCLILNRHQTVSAEYLLETVWHNSLGDPNLVQQNIRQIRLVIEVNPKEPQWIVTVPSQGYRFVGSLFFPERQTDSEIKRTVEPTTGTSGLVHAAANQSPNHADSSSQAVMLAAAESPQGMNLDVRRSWTTYAAVTVIAAVGLAFYAYSSAPGVPKSCEVAVNTLIVRDGQGREVWRKEFTTNLEHQFYKERGPICEFADLDGDGSNDVLFSARPQNFELESDTLYGFITRSRLLRRLRPSPSWTMTFTPGASLVVGPNSDPTIKRLYDEYLPPYFIAGIFPWKTESGEARIVVSSVMNNAPNQIAVLDGNLKKISEYWHAGHLKLGEFAKYNGHDRIFLAGVNNGYHAATLVSFDPGNIKGTSDLSLNLPDRTPLFAILASGTRGHLSPLGRGSETCQVLFERTCIAKAKPHREPYNRAIGVTVTENRIILRVAEGEREDRPENVVYEMDRHLNLIEAAPTTQFQQRHSELERAGLLDHPFSMDELKPLVHVLPGCEFVEK